MIDDRARFISFSISSWCALRVSLPEKDQEKHRNDGSTRLPKEKQKKHFRRRVEFQNRCFLFSFSRQTTVKNSFLIHFFDSHRNCEKKNKEERRVDFLCPKKIFFLNSSTRQVLRQFIDELNKISISGFDRNLKWFLTLSVIRSSVVRFVSF